MSSFAERLKELRKEKGISQLELAEKLNLKSGKQVVSNWEVGRNEPTLSDIRKIAEILGTTVSYLVDGFEAPGGPGEVVKPGHISVPMEEYIQLQRLKIDQMQKQQGDLLGTQSTEQA